MSIVLILFFIIVPYLLGNISTKVIREKNVGTAETYLVGFLFLFCVFEVVYFPLAYQNEPFSLVINTFIGVVAVICGLSLFFCFSRIREGITTTLRAFFPGKQPSLITLPGFSLLFGGLAGSIFKIFHLNADLSGDITLEIIQTTLYTDTMFQYASTSGGPRLIAAGLQEKLVGLPYFYSALTKIFSLEPGLIIYKIMPSLILVLSCLVLYMWARIFWPMEEYNALLKRSVFMGFVGILVFFGDYYAISFSYRIFYGGYMGETIVLVLIVPFILFSCMKRNLWYLLLGMAASMTLAHRDVGISYVIITICLYGLMLMIRKVVLRIKKKKTEASLMTAKEDADESK